MMNNTTLDVNQINLQEMKRLQQLLKMKEQIKEYNDKIEAVWTYAPLIIMTFGLTGKLQEQIYCQKTVTISHCKTG